MDIRKELGLAESCAVGEEDLALINRLSKAPLQAEQVYVFAVRLCDNDVDRDYERFDEQALSTLGDLFVGKTGIFDHQWSAGGQTARIYRTELVHESGIRTDAGDGYCYLKAWAYLLKNEKNRDLIDEIEAGIKKEVSIGCSIGRSVCSVCGAESGTCEHVKGHTYGGKLCYAELREPADAYEWSFVAVPAQRNAGVLRKQFGGESVVENEDMKLLRYQAELGRNYLKALRHEVVRLAMLADEHLDGKLFAAVAEKLDEPQLLELKGGYEDQIGRKFPAEPQLKRVRRAAAEGEEAFRV